MEDGFRGLSRQQFTREFKLAALQRLEMGAWVVEVAQAFTACLSPGDNLRN